uniref:Iron-sulfur cluster assembly 1 homolog, mitochondrial n=1 Tax=Mus spicilegus TaxID=10103 RepID=A0A8C6H2F1_MUSSI
MSRSLWHPSVHGELLRPHTPALGFCQHRWSTPLNPSAVNKIKQLLKDKPEHVGLKVGVRTRGCNDLSYSLESTKTKEDSDEEVSQAGV